MIGANWRGFYAPGEMTDEAYAFWVDALETMYDTPEWQSVMETNGLVDFQYSGEEFRSFVEQNIAEIGIIK